MTSAAIALSDNDSGTAMFANVTGLMPGTNVDRCIDVTYTGTVDPTAVLLYANAKFEDGRFLGGIELEVFPLDVVQEPSEQRVIAGTLIARQKIIKRRHGEKRQRPGIGKPLCGAQPDSESGERARPDRDGDPGEILHRDTGLAQHFVRKHHQALGMDVLFGHGPVRDDRAFMDKRRAAEFR